MSSVDERIVSMKFENSGFEAGATKVLDTLEKLDDALKLDGAVAGLDTLKNSMSNLRMDGVAAGVDTATRGFSVLGEIGIGALRKIGEEAVTLGQRLLTNLGSRLTKGARDGFGEYQNQMNSLQTISANSGEEMSVIKDRLDELNEYADKTIYSFSEMTANIGRFTAAGLDVTTSTNAIKGFANMAALAGAGSQETSRGMYQLSQAMASGVVKLQDWKSIQNASIDTAAFKDILIETARAMDSTETSVDAAIEKQGSFNGSLQEGWLTADVMSQALQVATMSTRDFADEEAGMQQRLKELSDMGYSEDVARKLIGIANAADDSAREVRTFKQLTDTVEEAIGSGWAKTWELLIGDFEEATVLFTTISKKFDELVGASADARNNLLKDWKDAGGRDSLIGSFANIVQAIANIIRPIKDAFTDVFSVSGEALAIATENFALFTEKLVAGGDTMNRINAVFHAAFMIVHELVGILVTAGRFVGGFVSLFAHGFSSLNSAVLPAASGILDYIADLLNGFHSKISTALDAFDLVVDRIKNFKDLKKTIDVTKEEWFEAATSPLWAFARMGESVHSIIIDLANVLKTGVIYAIDLGRTIWTILIPLRSLVAFLGSVIIFKVLPAAFEAVAGAISIAADALIGWWNILRRAMRPIRRIFKEAYTTIANFFTAIYEVFLESDIFKIISSWYDGITGFFSKLLSSIGFSGEIFGHGIDWYFIHPFKVLKDTLVDFNKNHNVQTFKDWIKNITNVVGGPFTLAFRGANWILEKLSWLVTGPLADGFRIITNWFSGLNIKNPFEGLFEWFSSLDIGGFLGGLNIPNPFEGLVNWFKELDIPGFFSGIELPSFLSDWVGTLATKFDELTGKSKSAADEVQKFKDEVSKKNTGKKGGLAKMLDTLSDAFGKLKKYFSDLRGSGKNFTQMIQTIFIDAYNTMRRWLNNIANSGTGFGSTIASAFSFVLDSIEKIPNALKNLFSRAETEAKNGATKFANSGKEVKDSAKGFLSGIFDNIPKLDDITGGVSGFFGGIVDSITDGFANLLTGGNGGWLKGSLAGLFDFSDVKIVLPDLATPVGEFVDKFSDILDRFPTKKIDDIVTNVSGWAKTGGQLWLFWNGNKWLRSLANFNNGLGKEGKGIGTFFEELPDAVTGGLKGLGKAFGEGLGGQFKAGMDSLSTGMKEFGKSFTPFKQSKAKSFLQIAEGIAVLVGALWLMAQIPADDLTRVAEAMLKFGLVAGALILFASWLATMAKLDLKGVGFALGGLGIGLVGMAAAIWIFTQASKDSNFVVGMNNFKLVLELLVGAMAILLVLSSGSNLAGVAATLLGMVAAITLAIVPIMLLSLIPDNLFEKGAFRLAALGTFFTGVAGFLSVIAESGTQALLATLALIPLIAAITLSIVPLVITAAIPDDLFDKGAFRIGALGTFFTGIASFLSIVAKNGVQAVLATMALIPMVAAITLATIPIMILGAIPHNKVIQGIDAITDISILFGFIIGFFTLVSTNIVSMVLGAVGLTLMMVPIAAMTAIITALSFIARVNMSGIKQAIETMEYVVAGLAGMALIGMYGGGGLLVLALGIAAISAAFALLAGVFGAIDFNSMVDSFSTFVTGVGDVAHNAIEGFIGVMAQAPFMFLEAAVDAASGFLQGLRDRFQSHSPSKATEEIGEDAIQGFVNGIANWISKMFESGEDSGSSFLEGIDVADLAGNLGTKAQEGLTAFLDGIDTDALAQKGGDMIAGLLKGIGDDLANKMKTKASEVFHFFVDPIKEFFGINSPSTYMQNEIGMNLIQGLVNGLSFLDGLRSKVSEIGGIITGGLANLPGLFGLKGTESVDTLSASLNNASGSVGTASVNLGIQAASGLLDFALQVGNKGSEGADSFVKGISTKTGVAKNEATKMSLAILTEATALKPKMRTKANEAMNAFCSGISAAAGRARSASASVMNAAASGIGSLWGRFYNTGKNAADGLAAGIYAGLGAARAAADRLMAEAEKAANARAKIKSPSRVFMGIGEYLGEGLAIGMGNTRAEVSRASSDLAGTTFDSFRSSLSTMSVGLDDLLDTDYNPVITPVIDSTEFDSSIGRLTTRMNALAPTDLSIGTVNYNQEFASKLSDYANTNRKAIEAVANNAIDYDILGASVANALIRSGVRVQMDSGEFVGYLAGEISDVRRMYM